MSTLQLSTGPYASKREMVLLEYFIEIRLFILQPRLLECLLSIYLDMHRRCP